MTLEAGKQFETLLRYLRDNRGFDYTGYKRNTIVRRVAKRCTELGLTSFGAYQDYLQVHGDEFAILFDKILINVTDFFRDPQAWDYVAKNIVPRIIEKPGLIRIWSPGTASGEEAYSAAILLCEALGPEQFLRRVKIYATDLDEEALEKARAGYTEQDLEAVNEVLRARYFESVGSRFAFKSSLRRSMIFGRHDLMQDAPISRLNLLICRNTLMYFTAETQGRILARFHYALEDDGYLFLGRAEMLLMHGSTFEPVDIKQRVFRKVPRPPLRERLMILSQSGSSQDHDNAGRQIRLNELASEASPLAHMVVDALGNLALANQHARRLLDIRAGDIGRALKDLELSNRTVDLRGPIDQSFRDRRSIAISGVEHPSPDGSVRRFEVQVAPLFDDGTILGTSVTFNDVTNEAALRAELDRSKQEVETAYEELQSSNEELETTNEELQSTVEELETTNEELQSTNEELETMNEELESTNAELQSINTELHQRTEVSNRLNTFMHAILGNIRLGAAVLDADLNVRVWNERAAELWGVRSDEVLGESLFDLDIGLPVKELRPMIRSVLNGKPPSHDEKVVAAITRRGKRIRCRVAATALAARGRAGGVVLVMEDLKPA